MMRQLRIEPKPCHFDMLHMIWRGEAATDNTKTAWAKATVPHLTCTYDTPAYIQEALYQTAPVDTGADRPATAQKSPHFHRAI
jgi:hypothetical protein